MKKTKLLSLLLCLSLVCTLFVSGTTAYAEGESNPGDGMVVNKTATVNNDGSTTITLEAFATGNKIITTETKDVPTDIILVIDQSGSMKEDIGSVTYTKYTEKNTQNKNNYDKRHNGGSANLWHRLDDGSYVSVSVTLQQTITYNKITKGRNDNSDNGYTNYWENRNNLYTYVNGEIKKVIYTRDRDWWLENWNCTYALEDGTILNQNNKGREYSPTFQDTDDGYLYLAVVNENQNLYTYTYTDNTGAVQTIGTPSTGANTYFTPAFYKRSTTTSGGGSRLAALKTAVTTFANNVATKAKGTDGSLGTDDDVNHRIAVVGFACGDNYSYTNYDYKNTEVFVGSNQYKYGTAAQSWYRRAFQSMDTSAGIGNISNSIGALAADGGTLTNLGLEMANGIFGANPVPQGAQRNRVVVLFTDGVPGWSGYESNVANAAITQANTAKNTHGATVYSVGIFSGADATSAGSSNGNDTEKANWFMQNVSSNNGTPRTPSYYLSAGDSASLNNIFQQISNNIQTGGSGTTLGSETVVRDIISPYFTLPEGASAANIQLNTYDCTGKDGDTYTWSSTSGDNGGARATVSGNTVSVTGFNFSENWCGTETDANNHTTVRGKKLVISFDVKPKDGFLGGNGVPTNTSAGIYENATADKPVKEFPIPTVNVPIKDVSVAAVDKNVYLRGNVTEENCKTGASALCGNVTLDLTKADQNYGLASWQTKFVTISTEVKDAQGNAIPAGGLQDLTADTTYTFTATVEPKSGSTPSAEGAPAEPKTGTATQNINVFKPELTFKDTEAYYGAAVPANLENNLKSTVWKHGDTTDASVTMLGSKPELTVTCTPDDSKILNGTINTTEDIGVDVTVKIGDRDVTDYTTYKHTDCAGKTCTVPNDYQFLIHVKTCTLTITKRVTGTVIDDGQSFIFTITGPGIAKRVVIQGEGSVILTGLKVGKYTVKEDTNWSWRYTPDQESYAAELSAEPNNDTKTVTVINTLKNEKWVSADVYCKNEFKNGGIKTIINGNGKTVNGNPVNN